MCLIIAGRADKLRKTLLETNNLMENIFRTNPDGIGVMFASKRRGLRIWKRLPKNATQARHFLERIPGDERNMAVHFRWTTHGDTDIVNCHPYIVVEGKAALMHNGILRTGNSADTTKSDTWHFIKNYLAGGAELAPAILHDAGFKAMLRDFIGGSNKFVIMTDNGEMSIINSTTGTEHEGLWFSNTYAWTPGLLIPGQRTYDTSYGGASGSNFRSRGGYGGAYGYGDFSGSDYSDYGGARRHHNGHTTYHSPSTSPASGTPSSSPAAGQGGLVVHNGGRTSATRFTQADEEEQEAWRQVVLRSQSKGWSSGGRSTATPAPSPSAGGSAGEDRGADGAGRQQAEQAAAAAAQEAATGTTEITDHLPTTEALSIALLDADVNRLNDWLEKFPSMVLHMLFLRYKPEPTKFSKEEDLEGYLRFIYAAAINEDRQTLLAESAHKDGSTMAIAEVLAFYLNWRVKPSPFGGLTQAEEVMPRLEDTDNRPRGERKDMVINGLKVANTEWPFPTSESESTKDDAHVEMPHEVVDAIGEAQMSQGGDTDGDDGFATRTMLM